MKGTPEFTAVLVAAGPTRGLGGGAGRWVVAAEAVRRAIDEGLFEGLPCFIDHARGHPSVRRLLGLWRDVVWDPRRAAAVGKLHVYDTAATRPAVALIEQWLAGPEPRPPLGISLVHYPLPSPDGRTIRGFAMLESADLVMYPASTGSRLLEKIAHSQNGEGEVETGDWETGDWEIGDWEIGRLEMNDMHETQEEPLELERATLAMEAGGATDGPVARRVVTPAAPESGPDDDPANVLAWLDALRATAAAALINSSGLPAPVQERLRAGRYESAEEVYAAIDGARAELAALAEPGVVRLGGRPPRDIRLRDPLDEARDLVAFFFGADGAADPPPNLRGFDDLYVALTGDVHFRGVFDGARVQFSGATTTTLADLAVDAMNRVIVQQFQALEHYRWFERITSVEPNDGRLHDMKWITLGGIANLPTVAEGAAYTELDVADVSESAAFIKRGGYVGITREMIRNSDILQLQAIPRALAAAAVRTRSAAVSALFTANSGVGPTLAQDSKALFHADHNNLQTTALGTDATAWRAARAECFKHAEVGTGKPLGIFPRFLLVPADLYDRALSILGYGEGMPATYTPEAQGRGFADPRPIPLVVPDWTDATDWAYIVDPAVFPVIQMSYSQNPGGRRHPIPELFTVVSETSGLVFSNDVLPVKVRDEFALGVNGPRGIGKRNAA